MIIRMEQFGLKPGEDRDITLPVLLALQACRDIDGATLQFPPGTYHFRPDDMLERQLYIRSLDQEGSRLIAFLLEGHRNLIIDGAGSEFRFEGPMIPFVLDQTAGVTLRDFKIDWDRPMFEQGMVVERDDSSFVLQLADGVPNVVKDGKVWFWFGGKLEPVWEMREMDSFSNGRSLAELRIEKVADEHKEQDGGRIRIYHGHHDLPKVGSLVAMRFDRRETPGIFITGGSDVLIQRVTVHHAPGMGLVAQSCKNIRLHTFNVALRPESRRGITVTADGAHFDNCRGSLVLEHCLFENQLDHALNVRNMLESPLQKEEQLDDYEENHRGEANLIVRYCTVRTNQARGLLVTTPAKVLIEFNRISAPGAGIKLFGSLNGRQESDPVEDVTIRFNTFDPDSYGHQDWVNAVIAIDSESESANMQNVTYHRNIRIEDNKFVTYGGAIVQGSHVDGFRFRNNRIRASDTYPWPMEKAHPLLELTSIHHADIGGNECPEGRSKGMLNGDPIELE